jgi:hypothetical protein
MWASDPQLWDQSPQLWANSPEVNNKRSISATLRHLGTNSGMQYAAKKRVKIYCGDFSFKKMANKVQDSCQWDLCQQRQNS